MIKGKIKGIKWERKVKEDLEKRGYLCIRQAASLFPDLIALFKGRFYFIECKTDRKYLSRKEKEKLIILMKQYGGLALLASKQRVGRYVVPYYEPIIKDN